jgi:hypothetical protein
VNRLTGLRLFLALAPIAFLAACGGDSASETDGRAASGEVLEGTISDAMLPLDTVHSQPPLAEPEVAARASVAGDDAATEAPEDEANEEAQGDETATPPVQVTPPAVD